MRNAYIYIYVYIYIYIHNGLFALTSAILTNSEFITFILSTEGEGDAVVVVVVVVVVGGFCN